MSAFYEELAKSNNIGDENENNTSRANVDKWIFRLLLIMIGTLPLIVLANVEEVISPLITSVDIMSSGMKGDLFTHYKAILLVVFTVFLSVLFLSKIFFMDGSLRKTYLNYVLGVFAIVVILSTIFSPNITLALSGQYNRSDGAITWLCYIILIFIAINTEIPKNAIRYIMYTLLPFIYINFYIILMNFIDNDLLEKLVVQKLVSSFLVEGASLSAGSQLVGTLNQWNYMSGMFAIMTIMYLAWSITSKKYLDNIVGSITAAIAVLIMFMAVSTSGFLTVLIMIPIIVISGFIIADKRKVSIALVTFLVIVIPSFNIIAEKNESIWEESFGFFLEKNPYDEQVKAFSFKENTAYASDQVIELPILPERGISAGTGRVYIWGKTLDLIQERPILGYGKDTLVYNFPHYNIDARAGLRDENTITDKAHNEYIGVLYGFGILGFISFIVIVGKVVFEFIRSIKKRSFDVFILSSAGCAYLIQLVFNDSLPGISAVLFVIIGISFAIELKNREFDLDGRNSGIS